MASSRRTSNGVLITEHAQQRYAERIRGISDPGYGERRRFLVELRRLMEDHGKVVSSQPEWVGVHPDEPETSRAECYIVIGTDICIPVDRNVALTVLTRGSFSSERRADKNRRKQSKRDQRRARRLSESWRGERAPRWH